MQAERRTIKLAWNCSSEAQLILLKDSVFAAKEKRVWVRMPKKRQFKLRLISFGTMRAESFGEANKTSELKRFACWEWFCRKR